MKAFMKQLVIQFRGDMRDKSVLMVYYMVPLVFYLVMASIFKLLGPEADKTMVTALSIFAMSMSAYLGLPQTLVHARENGVLEAYRVAGIPAWSMPLAAILNSFLHMMIVAVLILLTAPTLFHAQLPASIPAHLGAMALIALCSEALGVLLSCFVRKQSTLTLAGQCLFMPTILLSGIMFPASLLPKPMQIAAEILPATQGMRLLGNGAVNLLPFGVLMGITIAAFAASVFLFRKISRKA